MKVVLNTSPIIFLSKVESLTLLADCCAEIYVPQGVVDELHEYRLPDKIKTRSLSPEGVAYVQGALGRLRTDSANAYPKQYPGRSHDEATWNRDFGGQHPRFC